MKKYFKWEKTSNTKVFDVCFLIGEGWHSLHEQIPVLIYLKEKCENVKVLTIIPENNGKEMSLYAGKTYEILLKYSDAVIIQDWIASRCRMISRLHLSIHKKVIRRYMANQLDGLLDEIEIKNVFYGEDFNALGCLYVWGRYPPSHTNYYCIGGNSFPETLNAINLGTINRYPDDPILLSTTKFAVAEVEKISSYRFRNVIVSGSPLHDPWWKKRFKDIYNIGDMSPKTGVVSVALPKMEIPRRFTSFEIDEIITFINSNPQWKILLSFHPREERKKKNMFLKRLKTCYDICGDGLVIQAALADVLVYCGLSTGVGDAIATGTPIIEFYDDEFECEYRGQRWYQDEAGKSGTYFYVNDLLPHARTAAELQKKVNGCLCDGEWERYGQKCAKHIQSLSSCKIITDRLFQK